MALTKNGNYLIVNHLFFHTIRYAARPSDSDAHTTRGKNGGEKAECSVPSWTEGAQGERRRGTRGTKGRQRGWATLSTSERLCTRLKGFSLDFISHPITWHTLGRGGGGWQRLARDNTLRSGATRGYPVKMHERRLYHEMLHAIPFKSGCDAEARAANAALGGAFKPYFGAGS